MIIEASDDGDAKKDAKNNENFFADILEVGEIAIDGGLNFV